MNEISTDTIAVNDVIHRIVTLNERLNKFWSSSKGWAPVDAADLLGRSRLDWQVSLSHSLTRWINTPTANEIFAVQILGYANVGALVEGTLKLFLCVYYEDYKADIDAIKENKKNKLIDPDAAMFEKIRQFYKKSVWIDSPRDNWDPWIHHIQMRRNSIHAFKDRNIGTHNELVMDIRRYLVFVRRINSQLPYPDGMPTPSENDEHGINSLNWETDAPILKY